MARMASSVLRVEEPGKSARVNIKGGSRGEWGGGGTGRRKIRGQFVEAFERKRNGRVQRRRGVNYKSE